MRFYTVHAPPDAALERFAFVKDGISWPALLVPILWILWHRLWLTLMGAVIFVLLLAWIERLGGGSYATILGVLGSILFALEANNIRRVSLLRRGWREAGGAAGRNLEEAEIRFFQEREHVGASPRTAERNGAMARAAYRPPRRDSREEPIFGLFPEAER